MVRPSLTLRVVIPDKAADGLESTSRLASGCDLKSFVLGRECYSNHDRFAALLGRDTKHDVFNIVVALVVHLMDFVVVNHDRIARV